MSRLVGLVLADRARRRCLEELAIGRRRAGEARRLLEQLAVELERKKS